MRTPSDLRKIFNRTPVLRSNSCCLTKTKGYSRSCNNFVLTSRPTSSTPESLPSTYRYNLFEFESRTVDPHREK